MPANAHTSHAANTCLKPDYICKNGKVDGHALDVSVEHLTGRLRSILTTAAPTSSRPQAVVSKLSTARTAADPSKSAILPLQSDVWNGMEPINYHAEIQVGNPSQSFNVDLDTGSQVLWLQSRLDPSVDAEIPDQTTYTPARSSTSHALNDMTAISYGDGSSLLANLYTDNITLGTLTASQQLLGAVSTNNIKDNFRSKASHGIMGLGFPLRPSSLLDSSDGNSDLTGSKKQNNIVQTLHATGSIKYASMTLIGPRSDPKLAAEIDKSKTRQGRGHLIIGSVDPKYYTGNISWCPQIGSERWIVTLDSVSVNGLEIARNQKALVDTGTAYVIASPANYERVVGGIEGAEPWTKKKGLYFTYPKGSLKSVSFVFGGRRFDMFSHDFALGRVELVEQKKEGSGDMSTTTTAGVVREVSSIIRLEQWPFDDDLWIIGGIMLDNIVTIFDFDNRQIGFADMSTQEDLDSNSSTEK